MKPSDEVKKYLSEIGSLGGKKSKRSISPKEQRKMQKSRKKIGDIVIKEIDGEKYEYRVDSLMDKDSAEYKTLVSLTGKKRHFNLVLIGKQTEKGR